MLLDFWLVGLACWVGRSSIDLIRRVERWMLYGVNIIIMKNLEER